MAAKKTSKTSGTKGKTTTKGSPRVKDLSPKKDPRGGSTDHSPKGGKRNDY